MVRTPMFRPSPRRGGFFPRRAPGAILRPAELSTTTTIATGFADRDP